MLGRSDLLTLASIYRHSMHLIFYLFYAYIAGVMIVKFLQSWMHGRSGLPYFTEEITELLSHRNVAAATLFFLCYFLWLLSQTNLKGLIPMMQPFHWDPFFYRLDLWLGFGHTPWYWLQKTIGSPLLAKLSDLCYLIWFIVTPVVVMHQFFSKRRFLAHQYLISFVLIWVLLGHVVATIFSSVGPCFYHWLLPSPSEYQAMMAYLDRIHTISPLPSMTTMQILAPYKDRINILSAFPSMHVAAVVLTVCYARYLHHALFFIATIYAGLILIASVYLGWHYLSDGLFAMVGTIGIWHFSGWLLRRYPVLQ
jgi:hypothetical protein